MDYLTVNQLMFHSQLNIKPTIVKNIAERSKIQEAFKSKGGVERESGLMDETTGEPGVVKPLMYSGSVNTNYRTGPFDRITLKTFGGLTAAKYQFAKSYDGIVVAEDQLRVAKGSGQFSKRLASLLDTKNQQLKISYSNTLEKGIFWDAVRRGTNPIFGDTTKAYQLVDLIFPYRSGGGTVTGLGSVAAWNSVGGIDAATYDWWQNQSRTGVALSTTSLAKQMDQLFNDIVDENFGMPNLILMNRVAFELYQDSVRDQTMVTQTGKITKADIGIPQDHAYSNIPIYWSSDIKNPEDAAKGIIFMVNTEFLKYTIWKEMDMQMWDFVGPWTGNNSQLVRSQLWEHGYSMTCSNRAAQGVLHNIPTS